MTISELVTVSMECGHLIGQRPGMNTMPYHLLVAGVKDSFIQNTVTSTGAEVLPLLKNRWIDAAFRALGPSWSRVGPGSQGFSLSLNPNLGHF